MSRKRPDLPEDILKPDPGQADRIRNYIQMVKTLPAEGDLDGLEEQERLLSEQEWRARLDRIETRISRLEQYVHKLGITDTEDEL
jgi:hypothetical protein